MFLADIDSSMKKVFRTLLLSLMLLTAASTTSASAFTKCQEWSSLGPNPNNCFLDIGPYIGLLVKFVNHLDETTGEVVSDGVKSALDYGGQLSAEIVSIWN